MCDSTSNIKPKTNKNRHIDTENKQVFARRKKGEGVGEIGEGD